MDKDEFKQLFDLDGDGNLSAEEQATAAAMFKMVDKDGDGQLTQKELEQLAHANKPRGNR